MSADESPSINEDEGQAPNSSSSKRRSLRDRNSIATPVAGKLSPMELIGSLTFDIAKAEEGWKVKEHRNGVTKTFTSNCGKTFDSFEAIGEFAIAKNDFLEKLADDEGAIDALQSLARDGDERAVGALESLGVNIEEKEESVEEDNATHLSSPGNRTGDTQSKKRKSQAKANKVDKGRKTPKASKSGNTNLTVKTATSGQTFRHSNLDVTGMFDPKRNYCVIATATDSDVNETAASQPNFAFKMKGLNVTGLFDPKRNYSVTSDGAAGKSDD